MEINRKLLGERIAEGRKKSEMTQNDLAKLLNVQRQVISYYEKGTRTPNIDDLATMSQLFNTTTDYLLGLTDVESTDIEIRNISDYTGLNEKALTLAHHFKKGFDLSPDNRTTYSIIGSYFDVINFLMTSNIYGFSFVSSLGVYKHTLAEQTKTLKELTNCYLNSLKNKTYQQESQLSDNEAYKILEKVGYKKYLIEDGFKNFISEYAENELKEFENALDDFYEIAEYYDKVYYKEGKTNANDNKTKWHI